MTPPLQRPGFEHGRDIDDPQPDSGRVPAHFAFYDEHGAHLVPTDLIRDTRKEHQ